MTRLLIAFMILLLTACADEQEPDLLPTSQNAERVAVQVFEKRRGWQIKKYAITGREENESEWRFFFEGIDEYSRPGFHNLIFVDKKTMEVRVLPSE